MIYFFSVEHIGENIPRGENKLIKTKSALDFVYTTGWTSAIQSTDSWPKSLERWPNDVAMAYNHLSVIFQSPFSWLNGWGSSREIIGDSAL